MSVKIRKRPKIMLPIDGQLPLEKRRNLWACSANFNLRSDRQKEAIICRINDADERRSACSAL